MQLDRQPRTIRKSTRQPATVCRAGAGVRYPEREAVRQGAAVESELASCLEVVAVQAVPAFGRAPSCQRDQRRQLAVTGAVLSQQDQPEAGSLLVGETELGTDDQRQAVLSGCFVGAHDTGQRGFIGDCQRAVGEFLSALDQFFGM